ncbi:MAG: hypothetical protein ABSG03_07975, partial [Bryobacteraceae bacterium]
ARLSTGFTGPAVSEKWLPTLTRSVRSGSGFGAPHFRQPYWMSAKNRRTGGWAAGAVTRLPGPYIPYGG